MTRNLAFLNKDKKIVAIIPFNLSDPGDEGAYAGLLSDPTFIEVPVRSEATLGWKYINGEAVQNG